MGNRTPCPLGDIVNTNLFHINSILTLTEYAHSVSVTFYGTYHHLDNETQFILEPTLPDEIIGEVNVVQTKIKDFPIGAYFRLYINVAQSDTEISPYATKIERFKYMTIEVAWTEHPVKIDQIDHLVKRILLLHNVLPPEGSKSSSYQRKLRQLLKIYKKNSFKNLKSHEELTFQGLETMIDFKTDFRLEIAMLAQALYDSAETMAQKHLIEYYWSDCISSGISSMVD